LRTGIRQQKAKTADYDHTDSKICFDYQNNIFYTFKYGTTNTRVEAFNIPSFKRGGASHGFAKDYLQKRLSGIRSVVFGEDESQIDTKVAPSKLNVIQRIMKNVTTPVLIENRR
jgi:hypothetical protein